MSVQILLNTSETHVCVGYENGGVYFWDIRMNKISFSVPQKLAEPVLSAAFDPKCREGTQR
jgi:hypothetical protein